VIHVHGLKLGLELRYHRRRVNKKGKMPLKNPYWPMQNYIFMYLGIMMAMAILYDEEEGWIIAGGLGLGLGLGHHKHDVKRCPNADRVQRAEEEHARGFCLSLVKARQRPESRYDECYGHVARSDPGQLAS
jgi:hypothetical protein